MEELDKELNIKLFMAYSHLHAAAESALEYCRENDRSVPPNCFAPRCRKPESITIAAWTHTCAPSAQTPLLLTKFPFFSFHIH